MRTTSPLPQSEDVPADRDRGWELSTELVDSTAPVLTPHRDPVTSRETPHTHPLVPPFSALGRVEAPIVHATGTADDPAGQQAKERP
ncbi:hypothetical protein [Rhodococcus koreensis]|uniref:hypothetical protein n=1 Tax=Rhodococcus koreensis TaxID=99653 RepID=UPI0036D7C73E